MRKTLDSFLDVFIQSTFSSSYYFKEEKVGMSTGKYFSSNTFKNLRHFRGFGCRIFQNFFIFVCSWRKLTVLRNAFLIELDQFIGFFLTISIIFPHKVYLYREMCFHHFPRHHDKEAKRHSYIISITITTTTITIVIIIMIIIIDIMTRRREGTPTGLIRLSASLSPSHTFPTSSFLPSTSNQSGHCFAIGIYLIR